MTKRKQPLRPQDQACKLIFSYPEMVRDLLLGYVDEPWVPGLDFDSLEKVSGIQITDDLRERLNDTI